MVTGQLSNLLLLLLLGTLFADCCRHCISQNFPSALASLSPPSQLVASSTQFGFVFVAEAATTAPELLKLPLLEFGISSEGGGPADCHRIMRVDIMGGLTGLFSRMRSSSSITAADKRGSN